jgi:hypothetical protein
MHLADISGWKNYAASENLSQFVRLHPKTIKDESISKNLEIILADVDKMIYLYPDENSILLNINNNYSKVWTNWWERHLTNTEFSNNLFNSWPVLPGTPVDQIPVWILREFLSYNLMTSWQQQVEWCHIDRWQHSNCTVITISDLLYQFEKTLEHIKTFCNLTFTKSIKQLIPAHNQMMKLQVNLDQDHTCQKIIQSIINNDNFDWKELPLPSQAWIQWELRNRGFEIQCHGLDNLPTNSIQLKKLLYPI